MFLFKKIFLILLSSGCYPYTDRDPFFIQDCPHVYFVGNQEKYDTRVIKGIFILNSMLQKKYYFFCFAFYITSSPRNTNSFYTLIAGSEGQLVRLICVPKFSENGVAVMVSSKSFINVFLKMVFYSYITLPAFQQPHSFSLIFNISF